jgi:hypothetical protein
MPSFKTMNPFEFSLYYTGSNVKDYFATVSRHSKTPKRQLYYGVGHLADSFTIRSLLLVWRHNEPANILFPLALIYIWKFYDYCLSYFSYEVLLIVNS